MFKKNQWLVIIVLCIAAALYLPSFDNEFTNWDDNFNVVQNVDIKSFDIHTVQKVFNTTYVGMYMPITMLTYAFDFFISPEKPFMSHCTNLALHLLNVLLLWYLLKKLNIPIIYNFMACLVFAVHPLNSEAVYWISARGQLLFSLFSLLSINCYIKFKTEQKFLWYAIALFAFILGLLSKSLTVVLPAILLVFEHFIQKQKTKNYIPGLIPFFILSVIFSVVTFYLTTGMQEEDTIASLTQWHQRIFLVLYSWIFYVQKFFVPVSLSAYYPYIAEANNGLAFQYYLYSVIALVLFILFVLFRKYLITTWPFFILFIIFLLPISNIIPFGRSVVAERYAYPSIIGIELFVIFLITKIKQNYFKRMILLCSFIWILFLGYQTANRDKYWQNSTMLWQNITENNPDDYFSYYMYGNTLVESNNFYKAILQYNKALNLKPSDYKVLNNRGNVYGIIENYDAAINDYSEVLKIYPNDLTFFNRGKILLNNGQRDKACSDFVNAHQYGHPHALTYYEKFCKP